MEVFLHILSSNILPLLLMVSTGFVIQKKYQFDVKIFSKLLYVLFIPVLVFLKIYEMQLAITVLWNTLAFFGLLFFILYLLCKLYIKYKQISSDRASVILNSVLYYNSGNYAIPLILLVFPNNSLAFSVQVIIVVLQTLLPFTLGMVVINKGRKTRKELLMDLTRIPVIYALLLSIVFQLIPLELPASLFIPMQYVTDGFLSLALLTLGFQIANMSWKIPYRQVFFIHFTRLFLSPIIAIILVLLLGLSGTVAQVLIISSAVPTALNVVLLAIEYDSEPEFASQVVMSSTVLSIFSVTTIIAIVQAMF